MRIINVSVGSWIIWNLLILLSYAQPVTNDCPAQTANFNTARSGNVIFLGRPENLRYVVVVPGQNLQTLAKVRQCVTDAFLTQSSLGSYIHAGAFANRDFAESLSWLLRSWGLDARVVYFP